MPQCSCDFKIVKRYGLVKESQEHFVCFHCGQDYSKEKEYFEKLIYAEAYQLRKCASCGQYNQDTIKYCTKCRNILDSSLTMCRQCKHVFKYENQIVCPNCSFDSKWFDNLRDNMIINNDYKSLKLSEKYPERSVKELTSEIEIRQFISSEYVDIWESQGRPMRALIIDGVFYWETHYDFMIRFGYDMPVDIYLLWLSSGRPDITNWNIDKALEDERANRKIQDKKDQRKIMLGTDILALLGDTKRSRNLQDSVQNSIGHASGFGACVRCGTPLRGSICPHCQV